MKSPVDVLIEVVEPIIREDKIITLSANQLVAFLQAANGKRYFVVGHTDNKGEVDYNVKLESARADAVVAALVKAGINSNMLLAKGVGPFAPIASNATEEGQAKNRRVELVEK
jgi:OmpA-OmpF porin, OOP family